MNFGMIILNQSIKTMQSYVTWIQAVYSLMLKTEGFFEERRYC